MDLELSYGLNRESRFFLTGIREQGPVDPTDLPTSRVRPRTPTSMRHLLLQSDSFLWYSRSYPDPEISPDFPWKSNPTSCFGTPIRASPDSRACDSFLRFGHLRKQLSVAQVLG